MDIKQRSSVKVKEEGDNFRSELLGAQIAAYCITTRGRELDPIRETNQGQSGIIKGYLRLVLNFTRNTRPLVMNTVRVTSKINMRVM